MVLLPALPLARRQPAFLPASLLLMLLITH
jgi:hypothetical protein